MTINTLWHDPHQAVNANEHTMESRLGATRHAITILPVWERGGSIS
jgi:hypothetical protein